jgi:hypothetical protein
MRGLPEVISIRLGALHLIHLRYGEWRGLNYLKSISKTIGGASLPRCHLSRRRRYRQLWQLQPLSSEDRDRW